MLHFENSSIILDMCQLHSYLDFIIVLSFTCNLMCIVVAGTCAAHVQLKKNMPHHARKGSTYVYILHVSGIIKKWLWYWGEGGWGGVGGGLIGVGKSACALGVRGEYVL